MSVRPVTDIICNLFKGEMNLRMATAKAGPCVTDNGNFILDWKFEEGREYDWDKVNQKINNIAGVVETGIFFGMAAGVGTRGFHVGFLYPWVIFTRGYFQGYLVVFSTILAEKS